MTQAEAYIEQLPDGLDSYPDCRARLQVFMVFLERVPRHRWTPDFAAAIEPYLDVADSAWVPEVLCSTITLMVRDQLRSDDALVKLAYEESVALYHKPLYRALMMVLSPTLVAMGTAKRWAASHRGSELAVEKWDRNKDDTVIHLELRHPPGLFLNLHHLAYGEALRAAAAVTRTTACVEVESLPTVGRYRVSYSR